MAKTRAWPVDRTQQRVLDALQQRELRAPLLGLGILDQQRRLPVAAVRDQRVVGGQFVRDALGLEDALDAQHLLDLVLHGEAVLEAPGGIRSHRELPRALVREDAGAERRALARVLLEAHQIAGAARRRVHRPYAMRSSVSGCSGSRGVRRARSRSGGPPSGSRSCSGRRARSRPAASPAGRSSSRQRGTPSSRRRCRRGPSSARSARPSVPGTSCSTSRVLSPMFCTRRWQGTW